MKRAVVALTLLLSTPALLSIAAGAKEPDLPIPPIPPSTPPPMDAPMPNFTAPVPPDTVLRSPVTFDPAINHRGAPVTGFGYAPGANYQVDNDRHLFVPGVMLHMPFP
jgi:hypothetical protein